jgi:hypothetical protein
MKVGQYPMTLNVLNGLCLLLCLVAFFFWPAILPALAVLLLAERAHRRSQAPRGGLQVARLVLWVVVAPLVLVSLLTAKVALYDVYYQRLRLGSEVRAHDAVREIRTGLGRYAKLRGAFPPTLGQLVDLKLIEHRHASKCIHGYTEACFFGYMLSYQPDSLIAGSANPQEYSRFTLMAYPSYLSFGRRNFMLVHTGEILTRESMEDTNGSSEPAPANWRITASGIGQ